MFTKEELNAINTLISRATITGSEALQVAILQNKINNLMNPQPETQETTVEDDSTKSETVED